MNVNNVTTQDLYFGPLHLPPSVTNFYIDDTTATSLYLTSDVVADAVNNAYATGKITLVPGSAALPFPRPTGTPQILHGDGSPEGLVFASQGSMFMRRDNSGSGTALFAKTSGIEFATGWQPYAGAVAPATTLPATTPADGQQAILVDSTSAPTYSWLFQYSAAASKWLFLGGTPMFSNVETQQTAGSTGSYIDLATVGPSFTIPRAGDYLIRYGFSSSDPLHPTQAKWNIGGTLVGQGLFGAQTSGGNVQHGGVSRTEKFTGVAASALAKLQYDAGSTSVYFENRWAELTPIAVT